MLKILVSCFFVRTPRRGALQRESDDAWGIHAEPGLLHRTHVNLEAGIEGFAAAARIGPTVSSGKSIALLARFCEPIVRRVFH